MQTEQTETVDLLSYEPELVYATIGQRFANYLIDIVLFYLLAFALAIVIAFMSPDTLEALDSESGGFDLLDRLITLVLYGVYMGSVEALFNGKSLGKLITGTRAVNLDGSKISVATAFTRGFSRAVPFCALSAFGNPCYPWQDRWTYTLVIDEKKSVG